MDLQGRTAVITGANRGFGAAIGRAFVDAGASALLTARDDELLAQVVNELAADCLPGQSVTGLRADVTSAADCARVAEAAQERFGTVTALVNNAGVYGPKGPIEQVDWAEWTDAIAINLFGTVLMTRAFIPAMRAAGYGKIVNLSGGGATAPLPRFSAYAASKAAVVRLTETFAHELADRRIDVNAIAPGALNTRLLDEVLDAGPERVGEDFYAKALKQQQEGGAPLEKGAQLAVYLASAESDGVSGRLISALWDDWRAFGAQREELSASDVYTLRRIVPEDRRG
jgi:NAD(P)-dependent dehydrogenase (short-subunit alcohol dehydrogenase family)